MAEIVAGFIGPAIDVVKWIGAPIKRQFIYLCCFSSNITSLRKEAEQLERTAKELQGKVGRARDDLRVISEGVENWLENSKRIKDEIDGILTEVPTVKSGCLKLGARFSLSRRAKKATDSLKELRDQCKVDDEAISQPGPPASTKQVPPQTGYAEFGSRKQMEEEIMATLVGGDANIVGICGMGGVGKTTMAGRIRNKALENNVFNEAMMVVVSQPVDKLKIQLEIGRSLGLTKLEEESSESRRQKIYERLSGTKRILLILDDVWKSLKLEELGIPCNHKGCTILITSRNRDVLKAMNVEKVFGVEALSEEDAWILFRGRVGTHVDDDILNSLARDVVKKCKGLPLALTTIGAALKDELAKPSWRHALRELEKVQPGIPEYIEDVYNHIKLSYDFLGSKEHKLVLLLCCLFPEDAQISVEQLMYFSVGLGLYVGNIEEARDWIYSLTRMLINRSLLLDCTDDCVRMHDVVRDICKFISKQEGHDCTWIYLSQRSELPSMFAFPNLRLLILSRNWGDVKFELDNNILEGIKDLCVLSIEKLSLESLPRTTQSTKTLKTLVLKSCEELVTLSAVGELVNLEILSCCRCRLIEELPSEIKKLNRLKLLDLTGCKNLQRIGGGIISSLVALEELKMRESFSKWEKGQNASLKELGELKMLRCLEIEIKDRAALAAAENMYLPSKLDRFSIRFSQDSSEYFYMGQFDKKLDIRCKAEIYLGDWIEMQLLPHTESLCLIGNANYLAKCQKLRHLILKDCGSFKTSNAGLEYLELLNLPNLDKMWDDDRVSSNSFQNLKKLRLSHLPSLMYFGNDCPPQLEYLKIDNCERMEQVFLWKGESQNSHPITKVFPKLKNIELNNLPYLTSFYQGIEGIEFPELKNLEILWCTKMRSLVWRGMQSNENNTHIQNSCHEGLCGSLISSSIVGSLTKPTTKQDMNGDQRSLLFPKLEYLRLDDLRELESFCEWKCEDELPSLRHVRIYNCPKMKQVWKSTSISQHNQTKDCLPQLKFLCIWGCEMMEQVFLWNEEHRKNSIQSPNSRPVTKMFPKLKMVVLHCLPNMACFYQGIEGIEFPQLTELEINRCEKMRSLISKGMVSKENNLGGSSSSSKASIQHLSCQPQEVSFGCLERLDIDWNPFRNDGIDISILNGLKNLKISGGEGCTSLITPSIVKNLGNLTRLVIEDCSEMAHVITDDGKKGVSGGESTLLQFSKLQELILRGSPKLVSFCNWKCDVELPSLRGVYIHDCPNMKNLTVGSLVAPNLKSFNTDMNNFLQVPFNSTKKLRFTESENPLNCYKIDTFHFIGLEELSIFRYKGSTSVFPSSITGSLVNITTLTIEQCYDMVKVIGDDEEKENVGSSGQRRILFPQLQRLYMSDLFKLVNFCECNCDVELPSLMKVEIHYCNNMKRFTLGNLATPKLEYVRIDDNSFVDVKFLNGLLEQEQIEREKRKRMMSRMGELKMLRCLEIEIKDRAALAAAENVHLPSKLDRFFIRILFSQDSSNYHMGHYMGQFDKKLDIRCKEEIYLGYRIEMQLLPHTESLCLIGNVNFLAKCQNLRHLSLKDCGSFKTSKAGLEYHELSNLPKLEKKWDDDRVSSNSFQDLKELQLNNLPSLMYFGNDCPPQLEDLIIDNCEKMEQVFLWKGESQNSHPVTKVFPKLKKAQFFNLPNLTSFYQGIKGIEFPQLTYLNIRSCTKMRSLVSRGMQSNENNAHIQHSCHEGLCGSLISSSIAGSLTKPTTKQDMNGDQRTLLFPKLEKVLLDDLRESESFCEWKCEDELPSLRQVSIDNCPKMKQVWTSSSIHQDNQTKDCLPQLEFLHINKCEMMDQVFLWKGEHRKNSIQTPNFRPVTKMFPKLKTVELDSLPNMACFFQGIEGIEFPQLTKLEINRCEKMRSLISKGMISKENSLGGSSSSNKASIQHLSCQPQEVSFGCLERLDIDWNPFRNDGIDISFLNGLKTLKISGGEGCTSLITPSIVKNLGNLTRLVIEDCSEMAHVITDDG